MYDSIVSRSLFSLLDQVSNENSIVPATDQRRKIHVNKMEEKLRNEEIIKSSNFRRYKYTHISNKFFFQIRLGEPAFSNIIQWKSVISFFSIDKYLLQTFGLSINEKLSPRINAKEIREMISSREKCVDQEWFALRVESFKNWFQWEGNDEIT